MGHRQPSPAPWAAAFLVTALLFGALGLWGSDWWMLAAAVAAAASAAYLLTIPGQ